MVPSLSLSNREEASMISAVPSSVSCWPWCERGWGTQTGEGLPGAGTLPSWSSLQCCQCDGCALRQSPPSPPPDCMTFVCDCHRGVTRLLRWSDTGLHPGHNRKPWPLILMTVFHWRIVCNIGMSELLTGLFLDYLPCVRLNLSKLCCALNASPVFSF